MQGLGEGYVHYQHFGWVAFLPVIHYVCSHLAFYIWKFIVLLVQNSHKKWLLFSDFPFVILYQASTIYLFLYRWCEA